MDRPVQQISETIYGSGLKMSDGARVALTVLRGTERLEIAVTLAEAPPDFRKTR